MHLTDYPLTVSPNPANDEVNITLLSNKNFEIEIINATGEKIIRGQNQNSIDISNLASGIYFIKIYTADNVVTQKLVKQ